MEAPPGRFKRDSFKGEGRTREKTDRPVMPGAGPGL